MAQGVSPAAEHSADTEER